MEVAAGIDATRSTDVADDRTTLPRSQNSSNPNGSTARTSAAAAGLVAVALAVTGAATATHGTFSSSPSSIDSHIVGSQAPVDANGVLAGLPRAVAEGPLGSHGAVDAGSAAAAAVDAARSQAAARANRNLVRTAGPVARDQAAKTATARGVPAKVTTVRAAASSSSSIPAASPQVETRRRCIMWNESRGNYRVVDATGQWFGAYQFAVGTSDTAARLMGRVDLVGIPANRWAPADQDRAFYVIFNGGAGWSNWDVGYHC